MTALLLVASRLSARPFDRHPLLGVLSPGYAWMRTDGTADRDRGRRQGGPRRLAAHVAVARLSHCSICLGRTIPGSCRPATGIMPDRRRANAGYDRRGPA